MKNRLATRILCLILAFTMLVAVLPLTVFAEELGDAIEGTTPDTEVDVPEGDEEEEIDLSTAVDVDSAEALEALLALGTPIIRVVGDFTVDRTFFVTTDTIIFADEMHTLTREASFGGDIFVVGEDKDGVRTEQGVKLTLGSPLSTDSDKLIIDGNSSLMTAPVVGTVVFVVELSHANLYHGVTIKNATKVGNERVLEHTVSYHSRVGGAIAILANKASMNIYGGSYLNSRANDIVDSSTEEGMVSSYGGAFYNYGTLNVYGGLFEGNHAGRGGAFYNYRTLNLYSATVKNNTSSTTGGAIYVPASTVAFTYIGEENDVVEPEVLFQGNSATGAGAIYFSNIGTIQNTTFSLNTATSSYGGALQVRNSTLKIEKCSFVDNTALDSQGGAIYTTGTNGNEDERELEISNTSFSDNEAKKNGGVIYISGGARVYFSGGNMTANKADANGGAVYATASTVDINGATIAGNSAAAEGGAIYVTNAATIKMNRVNASGNSAISYGGFIQIDGSHADIYNSTISSNSAGGHGGGVCVWHGSTANIYATSFRENTAATNGGALATYPTDTLGTLVHSCTFEGNTAGNFGGAVWSSGKSQIEMYNITAQNNDAVYGGFFYFTAAGSVARIVGLTLSGNTDDKGGAIIWGNTVNAKLYIDKLKYIDKDYDGDWNDAYWASAIYNKVTVYEITGEVPAYEDYGTGEIIKPAPPVTATDVSTAAQLERALEVGYSNIRITADFEIDRTFYVKASTIIFSTKEVRLTRASGFGGDIFVVGRDADGEEYEEVTLTIGKEDSTAADMLTIDGNRDNMTVGVVGTVFFVCDGAALLLYHNLTVTNCKKVGNERVKSGEVSYPDNTGGAVAIATNGSVVTIYGGSYTNNAANDAVDGDNAAVYGGAFYNYGVMTVYGGTFSGNSAMRGGAFYNYRTLYIVNATIESNTAALLGGAIYIPNSTAAFTYLGEDADGVRGEVVFRGNSAQNAGAIYARNFMSVRNTLFDSNSSSNFGGAIQAGNIRLSVYYSKFTANTSGGHGAAIYMADVNNKEGVYDVYIYDTLFDSNVSDSYGGGLYMYSEIEGYVADSDFVGNKAARGAAIYMTGAKVEVNGALMTDNATTDKGGAWAIYTNSYALGNNITAIGNKTDAMGGFAYVQASVFDLYNSTVKNNSAASNGGAISMNYSDVNEHTTLANIYSTVFEGNTAGGNGGAIAIYPRSASCTLIHSCTFKSNSASNFGGAVWVSGPGQMKMYNSIGIANTAGSGGFAYITTATTQATIVGLIVSGNTDTKGGPIIWGNTFNAKLYIDKSQYIDLDATGALDAAYWAKAIYNKLTVYEVSEVIPKYLDYGNESYEHMSDATDVSSIDELEREIENGTKHIRVVADIEIDRTLYVTKDITIFTTITHTLTRAPGFVGDLFVIGEDKNGVSSLLTGGNAKLTLGNPKSVLKNLLVIDGNSDNMTTDVVGTVLFICNSATVELYDNVTMTNHKKLGNERAFEDRYVLSSDNRVGGALSIISSGALNIYGGDYSHNSVRVDEVIDNNDVLEVGRSSTNGGLFFNASNLNIYGGTFRDNQAARGALVYNYRVVKLRGGEFTGNFASSTGGVYYAPNTPQAHLYIGSPDGNEQITFDSNTSGGHGGALYVATLSIVLIYGNTVFSNNKSLEGAGGAACIYGGLVVRDSDFIGNTAHTRGGALYVSNSSAESVTRHTEITGCLFENNSASNGGALALYASSVDFPEGAIAEVNNSTFRGNSASIDVAGASTAAGGAIHADRKVSLVLNGSTIEENSASTEGGAIYAASLSTVTINDSTIARNSSGKYGGAITLRSSFMTIDGTTIVENTALSNGGAIYVSYQSSIDSNSTLTIKSSTLSANESEGNGGAIYFTRRDIEGEADVTHLTVKNSDFISNRAISGGAIFTVEDIVVYMRDVSFESNAADKGESGAGGAYSISGSIVEIDGAEFISNTATNNGGALSISGGAVVVMNDIEASKNSANNGGFVYSKSAQINLYNSAISENTSVAAAGAMYLDAGVAGGIYNTDFVGNEAGANGAALMIYTGGAKVVLHTVSFTENKTTAYGTIYISSKSLVDAYNLTASGNEAGKGGFLYVTTTGTILTAKGITVSGNTATDGGNIIWGNSVGAKLIIDKSEYTDLDHSGALDDAYWAEAIVNLLTVEEQAIATPTYEDYEPKSEPVVTKPTKKETSVDEIFNLAEGKVSNGSINSYYDQFPILDKSSNFMSDGVSTYENINGETVTVDNFIYQYKSPEGNGTVGEGLLIYQAMLYKRANPEENVSISLSAYRVSVSAAVNINRDSRYFGYMRNMPAGMEYDAFGFVRVAYLLVCAAKMGINVTVIGQLDGYPVPAKDELLDEYFTSRLDTPCDSNYASGVVDDFMNYKFCYWTLEEKGGTDMMHTKMCAVSHYLDMNGVAHKNAVFTSSSNLDGISGKGYNGNYNLQTSTIVSDHAQIYRVSKNYLDFMAEYCGQEQIYEWQDIMTLRNKAQIDLILAGRSDEIPEDEQIVYIGTENDNVFEMHFTPFGGETAVWDTVYQPYSKYITEMYNSEGPITFVFNVAEHSAGFAFAVQLHEIVAAAFHNNKNPENKFYVNLENFDASMMSDLVVGVDIGTLSINKMEFDGIHNKDILLSYVKDGVTHCVSLLNSCNFHGGSMSYQSNFMLVVKEQGMREDGVFFTMADNSTNGVVEHTYGEEKVYLPEDESLDGYTYRECLYCDKVIVTGVTHRPSDWIVDSEPTVGTHGVKHKECNACGTVLEVMETILEKELSQDYDEYSGTAFDKAASSIIDTGVSVTPGTIEALISLSPAVSDRGGVIVSNYNGHRDNQISLEVYRYGKIRLFTSSGGVSSEVFFNTDIRSDAPVHIAITMSGSTVMLYINGALSEVATLKGGVPQTTDVLKVGGDERRSNTQFFKGRIYSVALFDDVRTDAEILRDTVAVVEGVDGALYARSYTSVVSSEPEDKEIGKTFKQGGGINIGRINAKPLTVEAIFHVAQSMGGAAGVIFSSLTAQSDDGIALEMIEGGRLLFRVRNANESCDYVFDTDLRAVGATHIAVVEDGEMIKLYVNGALAEMRELVLHIPAVTDEIIVGADNRLANTAYFKGTLYALAMYSDVRDAKEIKRDSLAISDVGDGHIYSCYYGGGESNVPEAPAGEVFNAETSHRLDELAAPPRTIEAIIRVPVTLESRVGVIVGNFDKSSSAQINLEVLAGGKLRLFMYVGTLKVDCVFNYDIRSESLRHVAVTMDERNMSLYVDGELIETRRVKMVAPDAVSGFVVGGDNRVGNEQYFRGEIYAVYMFSGAKAAQEIADDYRLGVSGGEDLLCTREFVSTAHIDTAPAYRPEGITFDGSYTDKVGALDRAPKTIEATISLPSDLEGRGGVIVGNYGISSNRINVEVADGGKIRFFVKSKTHYIDHVFDVDLRRGEPVHIALTLDGGALTLYVDGELVESISVDEALSLKDNNFVIGGDHRIGNTQFFKGRIYAVNMFGGRRSAEEICSDMHAVDALDEELLYSKLYTYRTCDATNVGKGHIESDWIIDKEPDAESVGIKHKECSACGELISVAEIPNRPLDGIYEHLDYNKDGLVIGSDSEKISVDEVFSAPIATFEAVIQIDKDYDSRVGVLFGTYNGSTKNAVNFEVYEDGLPRLFFRTNRIGYTFMFNTDVRSEGVTHIAITIEGKSASLYVNGEWRETITMTVEAPTVTEGFVIGGDNRANSEQFFKGEIYSINLFSDIRSAEEIALDAIKVLEGEEDLIYSWCYPESVVQR